MRGLSSDEECHHPQAGGQGKQYWMIQFLAVILGPADDAWKSGVS
jgi:hypothetical protein